MRWKIAALSFAILVLAVLVGFNWLNWFGDKPAVEEKGEPIGVGTFEWSSTKEK